MKNILLSIFILIPFYGYTMSTYKEPLYVELATQAQNEISKNITEKYNVKIVGDYWALFDQVNGLGLRLEMKGPVSKDELRYIIIGCIQEYLCYINKDEAIRPYLKNYPFTPNNLSIAIFIHGIDENYKLHYPEISVASTGIGNLYYATNDPQNEFVYKTEEKETYEEALAIVKEQHPDFKDRCEYLDNK